MTTGGGGGTNAGLGAGLVFGIGLVTGLGAGAASLTGGRGGLMFKVIDLLGSSGAGAGAGVAELLAFFFPFPFCTGSSLTLGNTPVAILVFQAWLT